MDELKEYILSRMVALHMNLYVNPYGNTIEGASKKLQDTIRYDQLREVVRVNPQWSNEEFSRELSKRINEKRKEC